MSNNAANKRKALFYHFSDHLLFLKNNGLLGNINLKYDRTYICPICLEQFSVNDLDSNSPNMLTLEHAPPEVAGGHGVALTCKRCNSNSGREIDYHLTERLKEIDSRRLLPNTSIKGKITSGNITVQGNIDVDDNGVMKMTHSEKNNHVAKLLNFVDTVDPLHNPLIHIEFDKIKTDPTKLQIGLLKNAYILMFSKFGYSFILDGVYNIIREQIQYPNKNILPTNYWLNESFLLQEHEGIHICTTPTVESIFCVFPLISVARVHRYSVNLPIPYSSPMALVTNLKGLGAGTELKFSLLNNKHDFLFNLKNIISLNNWFLNVRLSKINNNDKLNIASSVHRILRPIQNWEYIYAKAEVIQPQYRPVFSIDIPQELG